MATWNLPINPAHIGRWLGRQRQPKLENANVTIHSETVHVNGRGVVVERLRPRPKSTALVAAVHEMPHQKVFRLIRAKQFEDAARLAKRLIDDGDTAGFFTYSGSAFRRAQILLADKIESARRSMTMEVHTLTPELAQAILENNLDNRRINSVGLAARMRDIAEGRWKLTGQGLIVARDGMLNDGQHRCWAVLLVGTGVRIPIVYGVARDTVTAVDLGKVRTGSDRFQFAGIKNYSKVSAMVGLAHRILSGRAPTEAEKFDIYAADSDLYQDAANMSGGLPRGAPGSSFGVVAFVLLKNGAPKDAVSKFFSQVKSGDGLTRRSPALALRDELLSKGLKISAEHWVYTVLHTYSLWRRGKKTSSIEAVHSMPELELA